MGRTGTSAQQVGLSPALRPSANNRKEESLDFTVMFASEEGEVLQIGESKLILQEGDPAMVMRGLAEVENIELQNDGTYQVTFRDGRVALVDLDELGVAFHEGEENDTLAAGALHAALAQRGANAAIWTDPDDARLYGGLAAAHQAWSDSPDDPEAFRALALASVETLRDISPSGDEDMPSGLSINGSDLVRRLEGEGPPLHDKTRDAIFRLRATTEKLHRAVTGAAGPDSAALGLLYQVDEDGNTILPEEKFAERRKASEEMGIPIPSSNIRLEPVLDDDGNETGELRSIGEYYFGPEEQLKFEKLRRARHRKDTFVLLRGGPGTGKDTFVREYAATSQRPLAVFTLGGAGQDLTEMIGSEGLDKAEIYEENWVKKRDAKGQEVLDKDGKPTLEKVKRLVGVVPVTNEKVGELTKAATGPTAIVLQEPEGLEDDLVQLNTMVGDRVGDPTGRFIRISSASGGMHEVHPDCKIFITYNDREGQNPIPDSVKDRALNMTFDYHTPEEEAARLAVAVTEAMNNPDSGDYEGLVRTYTADELLPMAHAVDMIRKESNENGTMKPLGFRNAARAYCELIQSGYDQDSDPVLSMCENLEFLMDMHDFPTDDRLKTLKETISDQKGRLQEIAKAAEAVAKQDNPDRD